MKAAALRAFIVAALFLGAVYLPHPHPQGIWYFGPGARWLVAIDHGGLTIGTSAYRPVADGSLVQDTVSLGWFPLLAAKLVVIALPLWLILRYARRQRRVQAAAG